MSEEKRLPSAGYFRGLKKKENKAKSSLQIRLSFIFIFLLALKKVCFQAEILGNLFNIYFLFCSFVYFLISLP